MHILKRNPIEPAEPEILQRKRPQLRLCQRSPPLKDGKLLTYFLLNVKILWNGSHWEGVEFSVLNSNHLEKEISLSICALSCGFLLLVISI